MDLPTEVLELREKVKQLELDNKTLLVDIRKLWHENRVYKSQL